MSISVTREFGYTN